ncbi:hypothetical protein SAMN05519103_05008 [Rhizobiales bacterium GAS113]|jgi:hypothetical protein|nr:hypothetical protein SAMN05519103_05008 [Rhizobiales bacterium GAS113]
MGHVILLSELERARPARLRGPLPAGGATISLFLGVRYERPATEHEAATITATSLVEMPQLGEAQVPRLPAPRSSEPRSSELISTGPNPCSPGGKRGS